jgi:hypothetical protein
MMAAYYMSQVVSEKGDELAKPRPEHRPIEELTRQEQAAVNAYKEATQWHMMPNWVKCVLGSSALLQMVSFFFLVFQDKTCFRPFALTSKIEDSYEDGGLEGSAVNIVKPMGWCALGMFFMACFGWKMTTCWCTSAGKKLLKERPQQQVEAADDTDGPAGPPPPEVA